MDKRKWAHTKSIILRVAICSSIHSSPYRKVRLFDCSLVGDFFFLARTSIRCCLFCRDWNKSCLLFFSSKPFSYFSAWTWSQRKRQWDPVQTSSNTRIAQINLPRNNRFLFCWRWTADDDWITAYNFHWKFNLQPFRSRCRRHSLWLADIAPQNCAHEKLNRKRKRKFSAQKSCTAHTCNAYIHSRIILAVTTDFLCFVLNTKARIIFS